ncbi:MAG: DinB family protein [Bacteroidota bacterium]|nr:DinB family protein [Bacteroidota bacterium]
MENNYRDEILSGLDETSNDLFQTIALFTQDQFNKVPFQNSWTAAQVAEHIFKSEKGIPVVLKGKNRPTERQPGEKVEKIKSIFLDYDLKMKSPESVFPSNEKHDKEQMAASLKANREEIVKVASTLDLKQTFYDFEFPTLGEFTGIEWLTFITCHTKRHTHQMKNIYSKLNEG